ncbi:hypothetical protein LINPERPRIM_LOCUS14514 [Linum perenne]
MYWRFATPTCNSSIIQRVGKALLMMDEFFVMHCLDLMGLGSHKETITCVMLGMQTPRGF